jgi:phosphoribosylformylglycinamidine synthase
MGEENYNIVAKYGYESYPANLMDPTLIPRCYAIQQVVTCVMMPHIERSTFQWNWAYPKDRNDEVSPWHEAL